MNALYLQCGGPTAVINCSLAGVIDEWQRRKPGRLWGCRLGLGGLLRDDWPDLTELPANVIAQLRTQPGMALGGGRHKLAEQEIEPVLLKLRQNQIEVLFVNGGNGSMAAAQVLASQANAVEYSSARQPLRVIGIPKTIDNDLAGTDVSPGYGSTARFIAQTTHDIACDLHSMRDFDDVAIYEVMGRYAGWVAAAAALARQQLGDAPDLILLPEVPVDEQHLLDRVQAVVRAKGVCLIVSGEGACDTSGAFLAEKLDLARLDPAGQHAFPMASGVAAYLARLIDQHLNLRVRRIRPDTLQRSSSLVFSTLDRALADSVGREAVSMALDGQSAVMVGLQQQNEGWIASAVSFANVTGQTRRLPPEFIDAAHFDVSPAFLTYAKPFLGEISRQLVQL